MTHRLGEWIPVVDVLAPLPVASMAGCCLATAPNGTGRYIYGVFPTSNIAATFWQFDTWRNAWEQLTSPTLAATDLLLTNVSMIVDGTSGLVYLFNSRSAVPVYHRFQSYNPATDTWTQIGPVAPAAGCLETPAGLAAAWAGDAILCHPCASAGVPASDDAIFLVGNNDDSAYIFGIGAGTWTAHAGANRAAICGVGTSLNWLPSVPTVLYSMRGGGSTLCDVLTIATGAFTNPGVAVLPAATAIVTTGVEIATDNRRNALIGQIGGRFYEGSPTAAAVGTISPIGQMYGINGTPHQGRGVCVCRVGNQEYVYYRKQTGSEFQRIEIVE
jgi:hypothetical protein